MIGTLALVLGSLCYVASAGLYLVGWLTKRHRSRRWAWMPLLGVVLAYGATFVIRRLECDCFFLSLQETIAFYAWALALLYLFLEWRFGSTIIGAFIVPLGALVTPISSLLSKAQAPLLPLLETPTLGSHIVVFFVAYAAFTLAFAASVAYLLQDRALQRKQLAWDLPPLVVMDRLNRWMVGLGFLLMIVAVITGMVLSNQVWGTPWVWLPRQLFSLVSLVIYGLYFLGRLLLHWSPRRMAWLTVIGFVFVLLTIAGGIA